MMHMDEHKTLQGFQGRVANRKPQGSCHAYGIGVVCDYEVSIAIEVALFDKLSPRENKGVPGNV